MSKPQFTETAWEEYLYWLTQDKRTTRKINELIKDIMRNGALDGVGKPEPLKGNMQGYFSRKIDEKNRLVYTILENDIIEIYSCKGHYKDK
ncbi:MAG: Txe/YoeB family addiction module toxin [Firmicutes bacterium]|nr:Txe/YoeB family addiction module toxin [Bacillota bacterium]